MAMNLVGGKYKCIILYHLSGGAKRTRDLLLLLEWISSKVLTEQLRQLEEDGLIERTVYAEVPPRVEYTLSAEGQTFLPVLQLMCDWGWEYDSRHQGIVKPCISRITE